MSEQSAYVVVGRIGRAHGIRGELAVEPRTDEPERRFAVGSVLDVGRPGAGDRGSDDRPRRRGDGPGEGSRESAPLPARLSVEASRRHQGRLLIRFAEVVDRTAAEALRGVELTCRVATGERPEDPEEFYDHQLVGLEVVDGTGTRRGVVAGVGHTGAQDLLHIDVDGREVLFPFVAALVPEVDLDARRILVDDRPGLLGPGGAESGGAESGGAEPQGGRRGQDEPGESRPPAEDAR